MGKTECTVGGFFDGYALDFDGDYLRLAPQGLIAWSIRKQDAEGRPLIVYVHPP